MNLLINKKNDAGQTVDCDENRNLPKQFFNNSRIEQPDKMKFSHLHVHTQFSLLDGAASIQSLYKKAMDDGMPALAISDHGNMFGVFEFVAEAHKHKDENGNLKVKPVVGCEFYITEDRHRKTFTKEQKDPRNHQILLAKNEQGYKNLSKLTSLGFIEGMYSKYPRIDKELIEKYHEGLIATTCCLGARVPQAILKKTEAEAEIEFKWWLDLFGEDYYVELQRHGMKEQDAVNQVLIKFAVKYNVKIIASNDSHYVDQSDFNAHDILLCINTGEKVATPALREFSDDDVHTKDLVFLTISFILRLLRKWSKYFMICRKQLITPTKLFRRSMYSILNEISYCRIFPYQKNLKRIKKRRRLKKVKCSVLIHSTSGSS